MKIPFSWLREFVDPGLGPREVAELLTMGGIEVEGVEHLKGEFTGVVVGEVVEVRGHPRSDHFKVCRVRLPGESRKVICGAPNVREGIKVPLALEGARLPGGVVHRREILGEPSEGMICSEAELGLTEEASGIMVLEDDAPLGVELGSHLGLEDWVLDLSPTPNRGDCLSVLGVAREVAALTGAPLRMPEASLREEDRAVEDFISVEVLAPEHCPRYTARFLWDVRIGPSPLWMRLRLERSGIRAINNVVDVTNYVMLELGQPLHAFDYDRLRGGKIVVRLAQQGERFVTLDGRERVLDGEVLLICDAEVPVAIGGVMGGLDSEIEEGTTRVLLESAFFNPLSIRRTSRALRLQTESSYRFERGVDPEGAPLAATRAAALMVALAGGKVARGVLDRYPLPQGRPEVPLRLRWLEQFMGMEFTEEEVEGYLRRLGMEPRRTGRGRWKVTPPSWRFDIEEEVDLAEEVGRLKGYGEVPEEPPRLVPLPRPKGDWAEREIRRIMVGMGFYEAITYSFISPKGLEALGLPRGDPRSRPLVLLNPLSEEQSVMRTTLLPGLLEAVRWNLNRGVKDLRLFELRKVFYPREGDLPEERRALGAVAVGDFVPSWWADKGRPTDFYFMKGCLEEVLKGLHLPEAEFVPAEAVPYLHPGQGAEVILEGQRVGCVGRLHPEVAERFGLEADPFVIELDVEPLAGRAFPFRKFAPLPRFPAVYRDIALLVDLQVQAGEVLRTVTSAGVEHLERVEIFDCYSGPPLPEGKKNLALRLFFRSPERTLTDEEVDRAQSEIVARLQEAGYTLRGA